MVKNVEPINGNNELERDLVVGVVPCRFRSQRFPGKPLALIAGKPMVWHVWKRATEAKTLDRVIVATEDDRIYETCIDMGIESIMTSEEHPTGTDRVAEVAERVDAEIFVNIQGDEPLINPRAIDAVAVELLKDPHVDVVNAYSLIDDSAELGNQNVVKVVTAIDGKALAYSRYGIPYEKGCGAIYKRQIGLYAFRQSAIQRYRSLTLGYLEQSEGVEMYRFLENGIAVKMVEVDERGSVAVDVPEDIARVEQKLGSG